MDRALEAQLAELAHEPRKQIAGVAGAAELRDVRARIGGADMNRRMVQDLRTMSLSAWMKSLIWNSVWRSSATAISSIASEIDLPIDLAISARRRPLNSWFALL